MIDENTKIADLISQYPFMKEKMIEKNKIFSNLNNPVMFRVVGKIARLKDVAKMSGENLEELIEYINTQIKKHTN